jgi:hypothetical protein
MATVLELFVTVVATTGVVLLATIFMRTLSGLPSKRKRSLTFRVDDIPAEDADTLDHNLKSVLKEVPDLQEDIGTLACRSLVRYSSDTLCATISIRTSLSADELSTRLRQAGHRHPYKYTCKFEGITPLYENKDCADVE